MAKWGSLTTTSILSVGYKFVFRKEEETSIPRLKYPRPEAANQLHLMPRLKYVEIYLHFTIGIGGVQHI
jgi:hypothetical protein